MKHFKEKRDLVSTPTVYPLLIILCCLVALIPIYFKLEGFISTSDYLTEEELKQEVIDSYGSSLPDFSLLGEEGFHARWLTDEEDKEFKCQLSKHCTIIRVATITSCKLGAEIVFDVYDGKKNLLSTQTTQTFYVEVGEFMNVELGSPALKERGFMKPLDAHCSESLPYV